MCRIFNLTLLSGSPHCAPGNCYFFSHDVLLLRLVVTLPTTRIQSSWSSKSLVKEGVTCYLCRMSYYCRSTTSSTPYYFLKPWTSVNKNHSLGGFSSWGRTAIFCGERLHLYAPAPFSRVSHMTHPHIGTAPSCFCTVQNTTRTWIPMWSSAGTSYLKNRLFTSGWPLPVVSPRSL